MFVLTSLFFFFQAEDGIRDDLVTGVQTCALPIFLGSYTQAERLVAWCTIQGWSVVQVVKECGSGVNDQRPRFLALLADRSEERRVGKECRSRWSPYH